MQMLFTDFSFYVFVTAVFCLFHVMKESNHRKALIVTASFIFYLQFSLAFTFLLIFTVVADFFIGLALARSRKNRIFVLSLLLNFIPFLFFKFRMIGLPNQLAYGSPADFVVPLGLSFYTFKSVSYILDIRRGIITPERSLLSYAFYVTYFPALLSGPVSRNLAFREADISGRDFSRTWDSFFLIITGLAKKVLVADQLHFLLEKVWAARTDTALDTVTAFFIALSVYVKLYCDFSGYSDIARGVSLLFHIDLIENFRFPMFATSPSDFWRRQHVSMSSWFHDYVYVPVIRLLRKTPTAAVLAGLVATFFLSAMWHGISWGSFTFFLIQASFSCAWFVLPAMRQLPVGITWAITQFIAVVSIFCLLAPGTHELQWVFQGMVTPGISSFGILGSELPVLTFGFLLIHVAHYFFRKSGRKGSLLLQPAWLAILLFFIILMDSRPVDFIYFQF